MGCLFVVLAAIFPRLTLFIIWLVRPRFVDSAFDTWIWPLLGLVFVPFATLMYLLFYATGGVLSGWEWFWVIIAGLFDVAHWGLGAVQRMRG